MVVPQVVAGYIIEALAVGEFAAAAIEIGTYVAFAAAGNKVAERKAKSNLKKLNGQDERNIIVKSTVEPHKIIYGEAVVGGVLAYANAIKSGAGDETNTLYYVIVHCAHEVESIDQIYYDNIVCASSTIVDGTEFTIAIGSPYYAQAGLEPSVKIEAHFGASDQTVSSMLSTNLPSDFSSNHRGRGRCYTAHEFNLYEGTQYAFETGPPSSITAHIRGRKIYDPRLDSTNGGSGSHRYTDPSTWEYSYNPILCCVDYMANYARRPVPYTEFNWTVIADEADICDEQVASPEFSPQLAERYRCDGQLSLGDSDAANIEAILSSCMGWVTKSAGLWEARAGSYKTPTWSINANHIVGEIVLKGVGNRLRYNGTRGVYYSNDRFAQQEEFPSLQDSAFLARDNGKELWLDINLVMTASLYQAQRIAYKFNQQSDFQKTCVVPVNWYGLNAKVGSVGEITYPPFGWVSKAFRVDHMVVMADQAPVLLTLQEDDSSAWADPDIGDYRTISATGEVTDDPLEILPCDNLAAVSVIGGTFVTWDLPPVRIDKVKLYASTNNAWANALLIYEGFNNSHFHPFDANDTSPEANARYYWVIAEYKGEESLREPNSDTSTITASRGTAAALDLADGSVTENKIGSGAVTEGKVGTGAVTENKIGSGAVTEGKVGSGAVTNGKLGDASVSTGKMQAGSVTDDIVLMEVASDSGSFSAKTITVTGPDGFGVGFDGAQYTAPSGVDTKIKVSIFAELQISTATSSGATGEMFAYLSGVVPSSPVEFFTKEISIEPYTTASGTWALLSGTFDILVRGGSTLSANIIAYRTYSTTGLAPAQTVYIRNYFVSMIPIKR